ncbi:MAG: YceD family protein [Terriglobales bacterium]
MFIEIHELELHAIDFEEEIRPGVLDLGEDLRQVEMLHTAGRAQLVEEQHGKHKIVKDIRLAGGLETRVELACARCLEAVRRDVSHKFDLLYRPQGADAGKEELSVTSAEAEVSYYQGEGLQLEEVLQEQVILSLPLKVICRDDCKGLCPHCGKNLNEQDCGCAEPLEDPRWSALKDIRGKLDH